MGNQCLLLKTFSLWYFLLQPQLIKADARQDLSHLPTPADRAIGCWEDRKLRGENARDSGLLGAALASPGLKEPRICGITRQFALAWTDRDSGFTA